MNHLRKLGAIAVAMALLQSTPACFGQFDLLYIGGADGTFSSASDWDGGFAPAFEFTQDSATFNSPSGATVNNDLDPANNTDNPGLPLQLGLGADPTGAASGSREDSGGFHFLDGSGDFTITGFPVQINAPNGNGVVIARVEPTAGTTQTFNNDLIVNSFDQGSARIVMLNTGSGGKLVFNGSVDFATSRMFIGDTFLDSPAVLEFNGDNVGAGRGGGGSSQSWASGGAVNHAGNSFFSVMRINPGDLQRVNPDGSTGTIEGGNGSHIIAGSSKAFGDPHSGSWENADLEYRAIGSIRVERFNDGYADRNTFSTNNADVDLSEYGLAVTFGANWNFRSEFDTSVGWIHQVWGREDENAAGDNLPGPNNPNTPGAREIQLHGSVTVDGAGALTVAAHGGIFASHYDGAEQIDLRLPGTSGEVAGANGRMVVNGKFYNNFMDPATQTSLGTLASGGIAQGAKVPNAGDALGLFVKPGQMVAEDGSLTNGTISVSYGTIALNGDSGDTWKGSQYRALNGSTTNIGHDNALGDAGSLVSIEGDSIVDIGTHTVAQKFINTAGTIRGNGTLTNAADWSIAGTVQPGGEVSSAADTLTFDFSGAAAGNTVQFESSSIVDFDLDAGTTSSTIDVLGAAVGGMTSVVFDDNTFAFTDLTGGSLAAGDYTLFAGDANTGYTLGGGVSLGGLEAYPGSSLSVSGDDIVLNLVSAGLTTGDLNGDGFVDGLDLGIQLGNFNQVADASGGELNGTDPVDGLDLGILLGAWNAPAGLGAASVPEPGTLLLLASGLITCAVRRR